MTALRLKDLLGSLPVEVHHDWGKQMALFVKRADGLPRFVFGGLFLALVAVFSGTALNVPGTALLITLLVIVLSTCGLEAWNSRKIRSAQSEVWDQMETHTPVALATITVMSEDGYRYALLVIRSEPFNLCTWAPLKDLRRMVVSYLSVIPGAVVVYSLSKAFEDHQSFWKGSVSIANDMAAATGISSRSAEYIYLPDSKPAIEEVTGRHVILYAKGHYQKRDLVSDLQRLVGEYTAITADKVSLSDILEVLWNIACPYVLERPDCGSIFFRILRRISWNSIQSGKPIRITELFEEFLSILALLKVYDQEVLVLDLGEPDPNILPLAVKA